MLEGECEVVAIVNRIVTEKCHFNKSLEEVRKFAKQLEGIAFQAKTVRVKALILENDWMC